MNLKVLEALAQAAASSYDGALDEKGEPIKIGLEREEGNPVLDSRNLDGFSVTFAGDTMTILYQYEILLKDVYRGNLESEVEQRVQDIANYLFKEASKNAGKKVSGKPEGEIDVHVQYLSNVRTFCTARRTYKIPSLNLEKDGMEEVDRLRKTYKDFLEIKYKK